MIYCIFNDTQFHWQWQWHWCKFSAFQSRLAVSSSAKEDLEFVHSFCTFAFNGNISLHVAADVEFLQYFGSSPEGRRWICLISFLHLHLTGITSDIVSIKFFAFLPSLCSVGTCKKCLKVDQKMRWFTCTDCRDWKSGEEEKSIVHWLTDN